MTYLLINATGLAVVILLLAGIRAREGSRFSYTYLFSATWAVFLIGSQLALGGRVRPQPTTLIILYTAWVVFLIASLSTAVVVPSRVSRVLPTIRRTRGLVILAGLILANIVVTYTQVRSYGLWSSGSGLRQLIDTLPDARLAGLTRGFDPPWYSQVFLNAYAYYIPLAVMLLRQGVIRGRTVVAIVCLAGLLGVSQYTRGPLLQIGMSLLVSGLIVYGLRARTVAVLGVVTALCLLLFGIGMQSVLQGHAQQAGTLDSVQVYAFGSAKAYESILHGTYDAQQGTLYSLEAPEYVLWKLGIADVYPEPVRRFTDIGPYVTNTYTMLDAFTLDFGVAGMLVGIVLLGALCMAVERWVYSRPSIASIVAYSYVATAMVMSVWNHELGRPGFPLTVAMALVIGALTRVPSSTRSSSEATRAARRTGLDPTPPTPKRLPA